MGLLVVWAFGIWLVSRSEITVGVLTAFIAYIGAFYGRLDSMSRIVSVTQRRRRCQAHLRHPGPRQQRARPGAARAAGQVQGSIGMRMRRGLPLRQPGVIRNLDLTSAPAR